MQLHNVSESLNLTRYRGKYLAIASLNIKPNELTMTTLEQKMG